MNIIIDLDGVLVDNVKFERKVLKYFLEKIMQKYKVSEREAEEMFWKVGKKSKGKKEWHDWRIYSKKLKLGDVWKKAHQKNLKYLKLIKGAKNFLFQLGKEGHKLILATDAIRPVVILKLNYFKLTKFFHLIFSQDDIGYIKNDEKYFKEIVKFVKASPENFVIIDNRLEGIRSAKRLGMKSIYVKRKEHTHLYLKEAKNVKPDFKVRSLKQAFEKIRVLQ